MKSPYNNIKIVAKTAHTDEGYRKERKLALSAPILKKALEDIRDDATIIRSFDSVAQAERHFETLASRAKSALALLDN